MEGLETKGDNEQRLVWKRRLIFGLYERGWRRAQIVALFRFLDWVMTLPIELDQQLKQEVYEFEEKKKMPYVTSFERLAKAEGLQEGLQEGLREGLQKGVQKGQAEGRQQGLSQFLLQLLRRRVGELSESVRKQLAKLSFEDLEALGLAALEFQSKAELTAWLKAHPPKPRTTRRRK